MEAILKKSELVIIVPVLNCLNYTQQVLATIKTKSRYKLIIIDNGSDDGTKEFFRSGVKDRLINYFPFRENKGVASSWNFGIKYAIRNFDSKYFLILNNDILLHPLAIDVLLETLSTKNVVLATATNVAGDISSPELVFGLPAPVKTLLSEAPDFSCFMMSLEAIEKVGYFDEYFYPAYFEDNDYHYRIKLAKLKAVKTNRSLYFHFGSRTIKANEKIKKQSNLGYVANREYYQEKWGGLPGAEKLPRFGPNS